MPDTPHDPREYVDIQADVAQNPHIFPGVAPVMDPGPFLVPDDPAEAYDFGVPETGDEEAGATLDLGMLDSVLDEWVAMERLREYLNGGPEKRPELPLGPGDIRLDNDGFMLPGAQFDPDGIAEKLSDWGLDKWRGSVPRPVLEPYFQPGDVDDQVAGPSQALHGHDSDETLAGGAGSDRLVRSSAALTPTKLTEQQREELEAIRRRLPVIDAFMKTPEGYEKVLQWLPELKSFTDEMLREKGVGGYMIFGEILNGLLQDGIGSGMKGWGRGAQVSTAQTRRKLLEALMPSMGHDDADQLIADLDALQQSDPEKHRRIIDGLDKLTTSEKAIELLGEALVGGGEMLDKLAIDVGIPAEDRPMVLNLARGVGAMLPYLGNPTSMVGRALFAAMTIGQASEAAYMEMLRAGISPQDPAAPTLLKIGTAISIVTNVIPFERLTAKLGGTMKGGHITGLTDLLGRMPPDKRVRFLSVTGVMIRDGAISTLTGFLELTLARLVNWHVSGGPENYKGDVWDFVLEGQTDDAEMNAIMGAFAPQMMKVAGGAAKYIRQKKNLKILWSGARRNFHRKPLSREFFQFLSRVTGQPVVKLMRSVGQIPGPDIIRDKVLSIRQQRGDRIPLTDDPELARKTEARFQDMSIRDALDLDHQAQGAGRMYDLGETVVNPENARVMPPGSVGIADSAYASWQDGALLYQHTNPLRRQFDADQQALEELSGSHPRVAEDADTMQEFNYLLERDGEVSVREYTRFADAVRQQAERVRSGEAEAFDLNRIVEETGSPAIADMVAKARRTVRGAGGKRGGPCLSTAEGTGSRSAASDGNLAAGTGEIPATLFQGCSGRR